MSTVTVLCFANLLYKYCFPLYKVLYYAYKRHEDAFEIEIYNRFIKEGDVVLDIGANIGFNSGIYVKNVGANGMVHAFEPDKINFRHLQNSFKNHITPNLRLINKAVSNRSGSIMIYTSKRLNVDHRTYPVENYESVYEVEALTIDEYLGRNNKVDFTKMDIQGAEYLALQGMEKTLKANRDVVVLSELWPNGLKEANVPFDNFIEYLYTLDFNLYLIKNDKIELLTESHMESIKKYEGDRFENILLSVRKIEAIL